MTDFIAKAEKLISRVNCEFIDIRFTETSSTSISLADNNVESVSSGSSLGCCVRIFNKGAWGFSSFNDVDLLEKKIFSTLENLKYFPERTSVLSKGLQVKKKLETWFITDPDSITFDEKFDLMNAYNNILKSNSKIQSTKVIYRETKSNKIYLNSEGTTLDYNRIYTGLSLTAIAKDGSNIQPFSFSDAGHGGYEIVQNKEDSAETVVKTAVDLLSAENVSGGNYSVILNPRLTGVFIHEAFGHLSEADFIYENDRMRELMKIGSRFGSEDLNVIDDGNIPILAGYIPLDDEGVAPQKNFLIKNGVLNGRLHNRETSAKMNEPLTGSARAISTAHEPIVRMTNTYIDKGKYKNEDLFSNIKDGIYAVDYFGGQTNLEMFTFSSAYGYEIKDGRIGRLLKNVILTGNVFDTLKNIRMIADDVTIFSTMGGCGKSGQSPLPVSLGGPHILIDDVLVGGKQ